MEEPGRNRTIMLTSNVSIPAGTEVRYYPNSLIRKRGKAREGAR